MKLVIMAFLALILVSGICVHQDRTIRNQKQTIEIQEHLIDLLQAPKAGLDVHKG